MVAIATVVYTLVWITFLIKYRIGRSYTSFDDDLIVEV